MPVKVIFTLLFITLLSGCATTGSGGAESDGSSKMLDVAMALRFEDVPVPNGFRAVTNESFIFQNDALRVGILKYAGRAYADQVVNFYKDQMPLYGWRFLNMLEYGRRIINFDREDQTCIVVIEPAKLNTYITVTVAPKAGRSSSYKSTSRQ
ncbi:MAG: hypothetical protein ABH843_06395 [Candidatus Omnitrophota bacterium]